jgi:hypothetical protein
MLTAFFTLITLFESSFFNGMRNHILIQKVQKVSLRTFIFSSFVALFEGRSEEQASVCMDFQLGQTIDDDPAFSRLVGAHELLLIKAWYGLQEKWFGGAALRTDGLETRFGYIRGTLETERGLAGSRASHHRWLDLQTNRASVVLVLGGVLESETQLLDHHLLIYNVKGVKGNHVYRGMRQLFIYGPEGLYTWWE